MQKLIELWRSEPLRVIAAALTALGVVLATVGAIEWDEALQAIAAIVVGLESGRWQVSPAPDAERRPRL